LRALWTCTAVKVSCFQVPHDSDLPAMSSQSFAFTRLSTFVVSSSTVALCKSIDQFVTTISDTPIR
jgi:hypothetical protein